MTKKEIIRLPKVINQDLSLDIASRYAYAFRDPVFWDENTKCPTTGDFYGETTTIGEPCPCCELPLREAYPPKETADYIKREIARSGAIAFLGLIDGKIAGSSWGYLTNPADLAVNKWKTKSMQQQVIKVLTQKVGSKFFYGSETFSTVKRQGLATDLQEARIEAVSKLGLPIVGRTLIGKTMARIYEKLGYQQIGMLDTENPERALYIYYSQEE